MLTIRAKYSDIKEWYDKTNEVITNYSNGLSNITLSENKKLIENEDLNTLYNKFNEFKNDYYLGTKPEFYSEYSIIADGEVLLKTQVDSITDTVSNFEKIICKNTYGNNNTCSQTTGYDPKDSNCNYSYCKWAGGYANGSCPYGQVPCSYSGCSSDMHDCLSNGSCSVNGCSNTTCSPNNTSCSNGGCGQSYNSKTTNSDTIKVDITCNRKS